MPIPAASNSSEPSGLMAFSERKLHSALERIRAPSKPVSNSASIARGVAMAVGLVTLMIALRRGILVGFDVEAFWKGLVSSGVMVAVVLLVQTCYYSKYLLGRPCSFSPNGARNI